MNKVRGEMSEEMRLEQLVNSVNLNGKEDPKNKLEIYKLVREDLTNLFKAVEDYANKKSQSASLFSILKNIFKRPKKDSPANYKISSKISIDNYLKKIGEIYIKECDNPEETEKIDECENKKTAIEQMENEYLIQFQGIIKGSIFEEYDGKRIHNVTIQTIEDYKNKEMSFTLISTTDWGFDKINVKENKLTALVSTQINEYVKENLTAFKKSLTKFMDYYERNLK